MRLLASSTVLACGLVAGHAFVVPGSSPTVSAPEVPALRPELSDRAEVAFGREDATALRPLLAGLALGLLVAIGARPAMAAEEISDSIKNGVKIFSENCTTCHAQGKNTLVPERSLDKYTLQKFGMFDAEKIKYQVVNGKNAMPSQDERLTKQDISDVANYVLWQAEKGW